MIWSRDDAKCSVYPLSSSFPTKNAENAASQLPGPSELRAPEISCSPLRGIGTATSLTYHSIYFTLFISFYFLEVFFERSIGMCSLIQNADCLIVYSVIATPSGLLSCEAIRL